MERLAILFIQGSTRDEIVRVADEALYAVKQGGRNQVATARLLPRI